MLLRAHVLPISEEQLKELVHTHTGDVLPLSLRLESGDEENIVVDISAINVALRVVRVEGTTTHRGKRSKVIAQIMRQASGPTRPSGYAEITSYT